MNNYSLNCNHRRRKGESSFTDKSTKVENSGVVPLKDITDGKSAGSCQCNDLYSYISVVIHSVN